MALIVKSLAKTKISEEVCGSSCKPTDPRPQARSQYSAVQVRKPVLSWGHEPLSRPQVGAVALDSSWTAACGSASSQSLQHPQAAPHTLSLYCRTGFLSSLRVDSQKLSHRRQTRASLEFQAANREGGPADTPPTGSCALPGSTSQLTLLAGERSVKRLKQKLTNKASLWLTLGPQHPGDKAEGSAI